jgi:hypothetical protein
MVMMLRRLTTVLAVALVTGATVSAARAQTPAPAPAPAGTPAAAKPAVSLGDVELTRAAIQVRRQALVTAAMDLEPKEEEKFWPLYREYRIAMAQVNDRLVKLVLEYLDDYDDLTDETAMRLLDEYLDVESARIGVKTKYVPRFAAVLPARKVARFFQIDNKLDAIINADLARVIPLAR